VVKIASPLGCFDLQISVGSNNVVIIDEACVLGHLRIYANDGAVVKIGKGAGFNGLVRLLLHEPRTITIGDGCLISGDTDITVSDMHSIVDLTTGNRVNPARDVTIQDRVWIGQRCIILKGTVIGQGSIVGAGSVVTSSIPENCIASGVPAQVKRSNVTWVQELLPGTADSR
jgi:acetyltransferase-like isoleucine patch superfamily enzyme